MGETEEKRYYLECRYIGMKPLEQEEPQEQEAEQPVQEQEEEIENLERESD